MSEENKVSPEFEEKVKVFLKALEELQKEHQIGIRPVITAFGPDLQVTDLTKLPKEAKEDEKLDVLEPEIIK